MNVDQIACRLNEIEIKIERGNDLTDGEWELWNKYTNSETLVHAKSKSFHAILSDLYDETGYYSSITGYKEAFEVSQDTLPSNVALLAYNAQEQDSFLNSWFDNIIHQTLKQNKNTCSCGYSVSCAITLDSDPSALVESFVNRSELQNNLERMTYFSFGKQLPLLFKSFSSHQIRLLIHTVRALKRVYGMDSLYIFNSHLVTYPRAKELFDILSLIANQMELSIFASWSLTNQSELGDLLTLRSPIESIYYWDSRNDNFVTFQD